MYISVRSLTQITKKGRPRLLPGGILRQHLMVGEGFNEGAEHEISVENKTLFSLLGSTFQVQGFRVANPIHKSELRQS